MTANFVLSYQGDLLAGVDEVGRGPLAGDVVTAAVILDPDNVIEGLADSKKLTDRRRQQLAVEIKEKSLFWYIARASVAEIDRYNILQATMMAMVRAITQIATMTMMVFWMLRMCSRWMPRSRVILMPMA